MSKNSVTGTAADRRAAAPYLEGQFSPDEVMAGDADPHWLVQLLVTHRLAATASLEAALRITAWSEAMARGMKQDAGLAHVERVVAKALSSTGDQ